MSYNQRYVVYPHPGVHYIIVHIARPLIARQLYNWLNKEQILVDLAYILLLNLSCNRLLL